MILPKNSRGEVARSKAVVVTALMDALPLAAFRLTLGSTHARLVCLFVNTPLQQLPKNMLYYASSDMLPHNHWGDWATEDTLIEFLSFME
eukprot:6169448-Amphidinium_carterae.1